jgi:hypothetical protein
MRDGDLAGHAFHQVGAYERPSALMYDQYDATVIAMTAT